MKGFFGSVLIVGLALGIGAFRATREFSAAGELFVPYNPNSQTSGESASHIVVVNGAKFEFGTLQRGTKMKHDFILQNVSDHPIELWVGASSCTCTVASLSGGGDDSPPDEEGLAGDTEERKRLEPGDKTSVTMEWEGLAPNPKFFQTAEIETDDPEQQTVRLIVSGYVESVVRILPEAVQMNNVSVEKGAVATTTIYTTLDEFPEVKDFEFMVKDTADFFELEWENDADLISSRQKSARRLVIRTKPGLPIGTVSQRLRLTLDLNGENTMYVPITAKVESDLSILGPSEYSAKLGLLRWGVVDREAGRETTLFVLVKGDKKEQVQLEVDSIEPADALAVEVLPVKNPEAKIWTIPVKVKLRSDAGTVSRLGGEESSYGVIRLKTGHPIADQLQFRIQFAVH